MATTLDIHQLTILSMIGEAVDQGRTIARWNDGNVEWGIARAFTRDGGGFLTSTDDVREGFIWISGGNRFTERWWPVAELLTGFDRCEVSLNYTPPKFL